jgi:hypothetical protein
MMQRFWQRRRVVISLLSILAVCAACVTTQQTHKVRPLPNFVAAAIEPGDTVIVTTYDHEDVEFIVTEVSENAIHSADREFRLVDVAELHKVGHQRPPTPCGGAEPLGCSVPFLVARASKEHGHYKEEFYEACEQHDYCYRHGYRTYGLDREFCDQEFLDNMQKSCPVGDDSTLGSIIEAFDDSMDTRTVCMTVAQDFYVAARDFGEKHYQGRFSSYCEYNGTP